MDLAPTTYTAPPSLKLSPVAPIYDAWHDLAGDYLSLAPAIRALPLDLVAASLGVPVWRTAWPDGVKAQVIAWYGQYGGQLYTRAGLAAFVWIFGGDLTTWGAITDYWETDPAGTPRTTAATPTTPMAYADDVVSSYIAEWTPLGRTLTLDSSAAVIPASKAIRRIIVTIPSGNLAAVPLGAPVGVWSSVSGYNYDFRLVSLEPTDEPTIFTGIIAAVHHFDGANDPAQLVSLDGDATAVMDTSIPDGILQRSYPAVATGDPVLTTGRAGWDAVEVSTHAELVIEVYTGSRYVNAAEFLSGAVWTATYASGDMVKFSVNRGEASISWRTVAPGVYGFELPVMALPGGPLPDGGWVSFTPDAPLHPKFYDDMPVPVVVDIISHGETTTYPAIPAIPALGTPVPLPPFATEPEA